ncbi:hypothetical protein NQZ68_031294 [Dissostichus eleginoides]|nr:hypothetical protein NQZ68_031294 [Dissostichus eleginoides]
MTGFDQTWLSKSKYSSWLYKTELVVSLRPDTQLGERPRPGGGRQRWKDKERMKTLVVCYGNNKAFRPSHKVPTGGEQKVE